MLPLVKGEILLPWIKIKNMRHISLFVVLLALSTVGSAQVIGKIFPEMDAETVEDKVVSLPEDTKGKFTLLGLAYSKKSEDELNSWFEPIFYKFIQKTKGLMGDFGYDVNVYFVPMFTGINAAATGTAKKKTLKKVDPQLLPYILFYKGELKKYKDELDFEKKDVPYFFVLDKEGKIIFATTGAFSESKMDQIEEVIE